MDRVAYVDEQLDTFKDSLTFYREQMSTWYAQAADAVSQATDMPSLLGMDRVIKVGNTSKSVSMNDGSFTSAVAQCPLKGPLLIESKFESIYDVPLGNIKVEVIPVAGGASTFITLDDQGKGSFQGEPGKFYRVKVQTQVTSAQVDALFASYSGLTSDLETWLRGKWAPLKPQWSTETLDASLLAAGNGVLTGGWEAIKGVWDGITQIYEILKDPIAFAKQLGQTAQDIAGMAQSAPAIMEQAMLLASDEAALFLLAKTAWVRIALIPPSAFVGKAAEAITQTVVQVIIDVLLSLVLDFLAAGLGVPYLVLRLKKYGELVVNAAKELVQELASIIKTFMAKVQQYKEVAARGVAGTVRNGKMRIGWSNKEHTKVVPHENVDDVPKQAHNEDEKASQACSATCTNGCPVSMVTGEELLTLTDGQLDGVLPFEWTRLYRTSAVETECGLGPGWSHALAQRVTIEGDKVIWLDHENRSTEFPLPSIKRPAITNSLSKAAIYLGDDPSELILTQAGDKARFYHFRFNRHDASLFAISDAYGNRLHLQRDILGRIKRVDNGAGRALLLRYDRTVIVGVDYQASRLADNLDDAWETLQNLVTYRYDDQRRLVEATNAVGESERYAYDAQHVIRQRQLAGGATFFWEWEGVGKSARCIHHWANFAQMDAHYTWGDDGSVTVLNADGSQEVYVHDDNARLVKQVDPDGAEHEKAYDEKGQLIAEKDPLGAITEYQYNETGRLTAVVPAEDAPTVYNYDNGFVSAVQRGNAEWKYQRNAQGDITRQLDPDGNATDYRYDSRGRLLDIRYADGSRHQLVWNKLGQLIEEQLPDGGQRRYRYDALGRQITRQDERGAVTQYQWNAVGRLTQVQLPGGGTKAFSYNAYGKLTSERDELGRVTRYEYADNLHLVSRRINPDGSQLSYRYDNARLLLTDIENERGEQYHLDYHVNGLIQQETGFDGRRTAYAYDLNGQLIKKTEFGDDGSELITQYQRDSAGRLLVKTLGDGEQIHYRYDALGRLVNVDDGHWPLAYEYDLQDRLTTEHQGWATLHYRYDALGQLSHARLPDGSTLDYRHERGGNLSAIDLNGQPLTRHSYAGGREQQRQQGQLLSQYHYDEQGRLTEHKVTQHQQRLLARFYDYDANGNLARISDSRKGLREYHYDPLDRLVTVRGDLTEAFSHDPAGNLLSQVPALDGNRVNVQGNRLLMQGDAHYDYDPYGNLSRERRGAGQRLVTEYAYDAQHRLVQARLPNGQVATYRYDAFGRRIEKVVGGNTTAFIWQGERLIAESAAGHYRSYVYEPGTFRPLAMVDGEGPANALPYYYQLDHLGTPQELTSAAGAILWSAQYRAYGSVKKLEVAEVENPLRFQGQYFDAETGLHYNRHRYYNPGTGRFLTPDPIKLAGGLNSYRYVPNPTGWVDPLGLAVKSASCPCSSEDDPLPTAGENDAQLPKGSDSSLSRNGAFRKAKEIGGVPRGQQPDTIYREKIRDQEQYVEGRVYIFHLKNGKTVTLREHSLGHKLDNHGPHFNTEVTGIDGTKTSLSVGDQDHTYFKKP